MTVVATQMFEYRPQETAPLDGNVVVVKVVVDAERSPHPLRNSWQLVPEVRSETEYVAVGAGALDRGRLRGGAGAALTVASRKHRKSRFEKSKRRTAKLQNAEQRTERSDSTQQQQIDCRR